MLSDVVKSVWGANSGAAFIKLGDGCPDGDKEGKEGRVISKVSVRGLKARVVLRVKSSQGQYAFLSEWFLCKKNNKIETKLLLSSMTYL